MTSEPVRAGAGWLHLREPADAEARSGELVDILRPHLPSGPLQIHDLGGGTGSMARWLAPRLDGPQRWVLHDRDAELLHLADELPPPRSRNGARRDCRDPPRRHHAPGRQRAGRRIVDHRLCPARHVHRRGGRPVRRHLCGRRLPRARDPDGRGPRAAGPSRPLGRPCDGGLQRAPATPQLRAGACSVPARPQPPSRDSSARVSRCCNAPAPGASRPTDRHSRPNGSPGGSVPRSSRTRASSSPRRRTLSDAGHRWPQERPRSPWTTSTSWPCPDGDEARSGSATTRPAVLAGQRGGLLLGGLTNPLHGRV